ncbi:MAG: cyclodeaminase/cyclohydrolase family protein [Clostridiales bacterium]|jgi:formiminotetrahydrofolate cyclodeaminase|nr:cyclodeaminase/cyclohydrolase family protein [Clostridiales bacterium]MCR5200577.1 cyclodeaminase/cyclohydrolase family protein [Saccharofermentans sp.]
MRELDLNNFTKELSSGAPVPGGGGASALMGAVSASLCSMVGNLTSGKKKYAEYQADIERIIASAVALNEDMLTLIEKDAEAFEPLAKAYSIPKEEPGRDEILEKALYEAALAPLEIVKKSKEVSELISELVVKGSRLAISDVGVAASACEACAKGASMNVYINTKLMKDREVAAKLNEETLALVADVCSACDKAYEEVKGGLGA